MYFYEVGTRPGVLIKQDGMCPGLVYFPCPPTLQATERWAGPGNEAGMPRRAVSEVQRSCTLLVGAAPTTA